MHDGFYNSISPHDRDFVVNVRHIYFEHDWVQYKVKTTNFGMSHVRNIYYHMNSIKKNRFNMETEESLLS